MSSINIFPNLAITQELQHIYNVASNLATLNLPSLTTTALTAQAQLAVQAQVQAQLAAQAQVQAQWTELAASFNNLASFTQTALTAQYTAQYQHLLQNVIESCNKIYQQILSSPYYDQASYIDEIESSVKSLLAEIQTQSHSATTDVDELKSKATASITSLSSYLPSSDKLNVKSALEFLLLIITLPDASDDTKLLQYCLQLSLILVIIARYFASLRNEQNTQSTDTEKQREV
ncbi:hypothetical protein H6A02_01645 [Veillonella magna]|uniref:hypothetical protein n=1 Tax=Veillonella magna TaxID=464322 RepID=UPI00196181EC|nr:hypothetical protein [Veillonella magna]MBM6823689.1 hypothetical protein [Veillonella magna]